MKPPRITVINPNRRAVYRRVLAQLRTLRSRMEALHITPEVEEMIQPHHGGYVYIQERDLYRSQLANFRALQSRTILPVVTPQTIQLEKINIRVGHGRMEEWHALNAVKAVLRDLQAECRPGVQHDLAERILSYWRWVRKLKPKQFREHIRHTIRR